jgi:hypothetical protein
MGTEFCILGCEEKVLFSFKNLPEFLFSEKKIGVNNFVLVFLSK